MRTNIVIDDELLNEAFSVSNAKTKKDLIHEALREFIRLKNRKPLTDLAGSGACQESCHLSHSLSRLF